MKPAINGRSRVRQWVFQGLRVVFRLLPLGVATRDRLRQVFLSRFATLVPDGPRGLTAEEFTAHRDRLRRSDGRAIGHVERKPGALPSSLPATLVAFYLPQFHPIPENDAAWGEGFTEWRNVLRADAQFESHVQPRLPGELGCYDLRDPATMQRQVALAKEYGIGAFCFYFYWFGGRRPLEAPLLHWLQDASLDLPFCLCWANESWSRRWDGRDNELLIEQRHHADDDLAFIAHVARYLRDPRYLRVDGKPLLLVYRPGLFPDMKATAKRWRDYCREHDIGEIELAYVQGFERPDPRRLGFDAAVEFPPNMSSPTNITAQQQLRNPDYAGQVLDWRSLVQEYRRRPSPAYPVFPGVNAGWDNEPRRSGRGRTYLHAAPRRYRDWLVATIRERLAQVPSTQRLVFVNAWNEWAEGAVLEPDSRLGHAWLDATRQALATAAMPERLPSSVQRKPCVVVHAWYLDVFDEILDALRASGVDWRLVVTTTPEQAPQVQAQLDDLQFDAEVVAAENGGRDILPFLRVADRLLDEGADVILKLHTKHSPHRADGAQWRQEMLQRLLAPSRAQTILQAFVDDPALGIVAPDGHLQPMDTYLAANRQAIEYLIVRLGIGVRDPLDRRFIAGSMFWVRASALRPILDAHLDEWEFEDEAGQVDGTMAHAVERIFGLCAEEAGLEVSSAAAVCGEPEHESPHYAYAQRSRS